MDRVAKSNMNKNKIKYRRCNSNQEKSQKRVFGGHFDGQR